MQIPKDRPKQPQHAQREDEKEWKRIEALASILALPPPSTDETTPLKKSKMHDSHEPRTPEARFSIALKTPLIPFSSFFYPIFLFLLSI